MRELLMIEIVVVVLLATSFTCVGLLAVWAATSPRHWFVRTFVFLAALSPLLLTPAYEPIVAFAIQGLVVACGVRIRNRCAQDASKKRSRQALKSRSSRPDFASPCRACCS